MRNLRESIYYAAQNALINRLLKSANIWVACDKTDGSQIYGWVCSGEWSGIPIFHYAYVKPVFRGYGLGRMLIGDKLSHRSHVSHWLDKYNKMPEYLIYNPYPLQQV